MEFLILLSTIPLFFYLIDGYYEKNIKRGVFQILGFVLAGVLVIAAITIFGWIAALCLPLIVFVLVVARKNIK